MGERLCLLFFGLIFGDYGLKFEFVYDGYVLIVKVIEFF